MMARTCVIAAQARVQERGPTYNLMHGRVWRKYVCRRRVQGQFPVRNFLYSVEEPSLFHVGIGCRVTLIISG